MLFFMLAILACCIYFSHFWIESRSKLKQFPGPRGLPFIGNALQFNPDKVFETFAELAEKHGGAYRVWGFGKEALILSSPESFYEGLVKRGKAYSGRESLSRVELAGQEENVANLQPTKIWRKLRKESYQCMKMFDAGLTKLEDLSHKVIEDAIDDINKTRNTEFNLKPVIYRATVNFMMQLLVGKLYSFSDLTYQKVVQTEQLMPIIFGGSAQSILLEVFPLARFLGASKIYNTVKDFEQRALELIRTLKLEMQTSLEKESSIVYKLNELGQATPDISDKAIDTTYITLILAGVSTTTNTMYSMFNFLLHYPLVYSCLQAEVSKALGHRKVTLKDRTHMPYLMATIEETLRLSSILPFLVPHATHAQTEMDGKPVPEGTLVFFNAWSLHHNPNIFPEPWVFKPERFLSPNGELLPADHVTRRNVYAFGAGARVCIGEIVARTRLFLITASLLQRFQFTKGETVSSPDPRDFITGSPLQCQTYTVKVCDPSI